MKSVFVQTTETEAQSGRATSPTTPLLPSASNIVASISSRLLGTQMMEPTNSTPRVEAATSPATAMSPESEESYIASETVKVTALMDQTRRLQRELDQNVAATKADHEARMAALNETLQNLRAERKATEPARTQLKMELKRLEELKRNSDAARSKAENGLNAAKAEQECTRSEIVRSAKEVETLKSDIVRMQQRAKIDEEAFEKKGKELEAQLGKIKSELKGVDAQRARAKKVEEDILNEIRVKEAVIAEIESETQSLLQKGQSKRMEELDEIEKAVEEDLKVWTEIQDKLLCEHLKNKAELKEEKRVKEVLLQELAKARSKHHSSSSSVAQSVLENRPSNKGPKIRLLQPSSELPSQPSYTETTCSLFSDFASTPTSSSQPTAPLQMCPPALQHPSSPFAGLQASSTPSNPSVVSQLPQSTMPLLEPIIPFETIQSSTLLQPPPPMHQPIPQQSVPVLPPGLTPSFDLMGALPRLPTSQPRGFNSATGLLSTPKEPPGLSGFAYTHAPSHAEARKSGNGSSHSLNSDKGDEIERAVANSLMGEINAFTI
ncbi:hypothetical protein BC830DRAFT_215849 [Chytriomyces sp. MP71]|nr:hypothetical protein BC830DRAFT_215849 [Chytriomyces sp. MP71]